ncbi:hypothetical protein A2W24_01290 [Microgenomates group bacterium RBG_16_45_19]|nr:MAG: hypothetical protein A2W24_01290 [Microgenomates group bacterium RBG_16_45_19]
MTDHIVKRAGFLLSLLFIFWLSSMLMAVAYAYHSGVLQSQLITPLLTRYHAWQNLRTQQNLAEDQGQLVVPSPTPESDSAGSASSPATNRSPLSTWRYGRQPAPTYPPQPTFDLEQWRQETAASQQQWLNEQQLSDNYDQRVAETEAEAHSAFDQKVAQMQQETKQKLCASGWTQYCQ